ncbi:hypothetical protein ACRALDRAFT_2019550 [Sodiomyces alcalophilus JCM 7366]|uniref:uncharacterized protein n=1 Tax=Sodiomyces alcalophilus JCM 7366 TaxID=591952 RepID=UPI0039B6A7FB
MLANARFFWYQQEFYLAKIKSWAAGLLPFRPLVPPSQNLFGPKDRYVPTFTCSNPALRNCMAMESNLTRTPRRTMAKECHHQTLNKYRETLKYPHEAFYHVRLIMDVANPSTYLRYWHLTRTVVVNDAAAPQDVWDTERSLLLHYASGSGEYPLQAHPENMLDNVLVNPLSPHRSRGKAAALVRRLQPESSFGYMTWWQSATRVSEKENKLTNLNANTRFNRPIELPKT